MLGQGSRCTRWNVREGWRGGGDGQQRRGQPPASGPGPGPTPEEGWREARAGEEKPRASAVPGRSWPDPRGVSYEAESSGPRKAGTGLLWAPPGPPSPGDSPGKAYPQRECSGKPKRKAQGRPGRGPSAGRAGVSSMATAYPLRTPPRGSMLPLCVGGGSPQLLGGT